MVMIILSLGIISMVSRSQLPHVIECMVLIYDSMGGSEI